MAPAAMLCSGPHAAFGEGRARNSVRVCAGVRALLACLPGLQRIGLLPAFTCVQVPSCEGRVPGLAERLPGAVAAAWRRWVVGRSTNLHAATHPSIITLLQGRVRCRGLAAGCGARECTVLLSSCVCGCEWLGLPHGRRMQCPPLPVCCPVCALPVKTKVGDSGHGECNVGPCRSSAVCAPQGHTSCSGTTCLRKPRRTRCGHSSSPREPHSCIKPLVDWPHCRHSQQSSSSSSSSP